MPALGILVMVWPVAEVGPWRLTMVILYQREQIRQRKEKALIPDFFLRHCHLSEDLYGLVGIGVMVQGM